MANSWLNDCNTEQTICNTDQKLYIKQQPSCSISNLSLLFITTVSYYNLTKQQALDAIAYFLYEYDDLIHSQLLDCFINQQFLYKPVNKHCFTINYNQKITGIFTPLTKCYSPSCQLNHVTCYSPLCPNKRISSLLHLVQTEQDIDREQNNTPKDWIQSIPQHVRNSTNRKELKRQAGIAELLLTEQNYRHDLDILHAIYAVPLLESNAINSSRRQRFYNNVFGNYLDITHIHHSFYNQFRQSGYFIGRVGTIIMQHVTNLIEPYIQYASNHIKAIYCMTIEHKYNPLFSKFLSTQNALKCTRRLGLRHYLTSPTLWMGKLKLMVQAILKNTVDDADQLSLKASLAILHDILCRMNSCANLSPEDFRFEELSTSIYCALPGGNPEELLDIPEKSVLIREEALWLARSTHPLQPSICHVFLFSHALILTHPRVINGRTEYNVVTSIPIQLLSLDNANTSMIRRLSFASTSMVSTPIHLINNLRRQKSVNSEGGADSRKSRIKNKLFKLRWGTPSPVTVSRRDSAPALLYKPRTLQTRTLKISHMAYPDNAYKLEFLSRSDRLIWQNVIQDVIKDSKSQLFNIKVCDTLPQIGKIKCAHAFVYLNQSMVVFGTQSGVWMGPDDGPFQLVLPNQDVFQLDILQDKLIILTQKHLLIAYSLISITDWCVVKRSFVNCFTVGKIRNQPVIIYLTKRLQTTWLVIIVPSVLSIKKHWFKKYIMEHKVSIKDPTTIQIINDSVFIRSDRYGIERIDIATTANDLSVETHLVFMGPNVGMVSLKSGFVCDSQYAYSVSLFDHVQANHHLIRIRFESPINHIAIVYPYLVAFASSVIEVRNIETTELIQALRGNQIQFVSVGNNEARLFFTMLNQDRITTSIYQLEL